MMEIVDWYLKEQIDILRLMLYREEFIPSNQYDCPHCGPLLRKIELLHLELTKSEDQAAA